MKVWPIDPLVPRNLRLEVPEKLPQGSTMADLQSDELATAGELSAEFISEQYLDLHR